MLAGKRLSSLEIFLTHFIPLVSFCTLWKYQKTPGFLMFPMEEIIDMEWVEW